MATIHTHSYTWSPTAPTWPSRLRINLTIFFLAPMHSGNWVYLGKTVSPENLGTLPTGSLSLELYLQFFSKMLFLVSKQLLSTEVPRVDFRSSRTPLNQIQKKLCVYHMVIFLRKRSITFNRFSLWSVTPKIWEPAWYVLGMREHNELNIYCASVAYEISSDKSRKVGGALQ